MPLPPYNQITNHKLSNQEKTEKIQEYINKLQYNHTGMQFFDIRKERPIAGLMDIARKIIDECLPIKCLEAVILSIYLTNEINTLEKFSISFKTCSNKKIHRHVVLGLYCHKTSKFGTVGISRRSELSYKPLKFETLSDLLNDFICTYSKFMHKVKRIRMGSPIPNVNRSYESIDWNCLNVFPVESNRDWIRQVEKHSRSIRLCNNYFTQSSSSNQKFNSEISLKTPKASAANHKQNEFNKANDLQVQVEVANKVLETVTIIDKPKLRSIRV
jgi:hypothetical protein